MPISVRLGFGCAYLAGGLNRRAARRQVDIALDRGVQHFDVAPGYGLGTAEDTLALALGNRRHAVAIATKVGLPGDRANPLKLAVRSAAAPLRAAMPRLARSQPAVSATPPSDISVARFDRDFVQRSVEQSLRRLRTDHIDMLLLHEIRPFQMTHELAELLLSLQADGKVGLIGPAGHRIDNAAIITAWPDLFGVDQHSWNVFDAVPIADHRIDVLHVTHRAVMGALDLLRRRLEDAGEVDRLSAVVGRDLGDPREHAPLLIGAALSANPVGRTLVASRSHRRLTDNLRVLDESAFIAQGAALWHYLTDQKYPA